MTEPELLELLDKVRTRWRSDLDDATHLAWRAELELVTHDAARQALTNLHVRSPHHRPTIDDFQSEVQTITNPGRLPDAQIARNMRGIQQMRAAWNNRHQGSNA